MIKATIKDVYDYTAKAKDSLYAQASSAHGVRPKVYLHWSAGHYGQFFDDYHIMIDKNGEIYLSTTDFSQYLSHTWKRNTGAIGIALACAYRANTVNLGPEPPTAKQIETMAEVIAYICKALWYNGVQKTDVLTHGEAADNEDGVYFHDPYGPKSTVERWDLEYLGTNESPKYNPYAVDGSRGGDVLRGKANWYFNRIPF